MTALTPAKAKVIKDERAAEAEYRKELRSVTHIVREWAATLTPKNAPDPKELGPLAWVRGMKAEELILLLTKAGHK